MSLNVTSIVGVMMIGDENTSCSYTYAHSVYVCAAHAHPYAHTHIHIYKWNHEDDFCWNATFDYN